MKVILSCTTTYERSDFFYYCLQSLLKQSYTPDRFLVNISKEPYLRDSGFSELPNWLKDDRITINWVKNIGSYRKLLPAIDVAEEGDIIITSDDDVLYHKDWMKELLEAYNSNRDSIICGRGRKMKKNIFGEWKNYHSWNRIKEKLSGQYLIPTGVGGVLYDKRLLDINFLLDKTFLEIAPTTDDLWFKAASLLKSTPIYVKPNIHKKNKLIIHNEGLEEINVKTRKEKSYGVRKFKSAWVKFANYLGINQTPNDKHWDNILRYIDNQYNKKI